MPNEFLNESIESLIEILSTDEFDLLDEEEKNRIVVTILDSRIPRESRRNIFEVIKSLSTEQYESLYGKEDDRSWLD